MGTHIRAKLVSNLDSRTIAGGPVEATLPVPFVLKGEVVLPARTMLYGHASDSGGRFRIDFTQMRLPDDREYAFEALAFDRGDNKPGLAAAETIAPAQSSGGQEGLGLQIARGTGGVLLSQVTGGVVQDVARGAGSAVVTHREDGSKGGGGQAILLDGGAVFDVWISKGF